MTAQEEFTALFSACWEDGLVAPRALADWLCDNAPRHGQRCIEATYRYSEAHNDSVVILTVAAISDYLLRLNFTEPSLGLSDTREIHAADLASFLPYWLSQQMDFLCYVLSK